MRKIDEEINIVNLAIAGISPISSIHGIVRVTEKNGEKINYDNNQKPVFFDDKYKLFLYHKVKSENLSVLQEKGKVKLYQSTAVLDMIVYAEDSSFIDEIINGMSTVKQARINNIELDSLKVLRSETFLKSFDFDKYIFSVNYSLLYKLDCKVKCQ